MTKLINFCLGIAEAVRQLTVAFYRWVTGKHYWWDTQH